MPCSQPSNSKLSPASPMAATPCKCNNTPQMPIRAGSLACMYHCRLSSCGQLWPVLLKSRVCALIGLLDCVSVCVGLWDWDRLVMCADIFMTFWSNCMVFLYVLQRRRGLACNASTGPKNPYNFFEHRLHIDFHRVTVNCTCLKIDTD